MIGSGREVAAGLRARLDERRGEASLPGLAGDLFAAADLIGSDTLLRGTLSDAGQPIATRQGTVQAVFAGHVSPLAVETLSDVAGQRWSDPTSMLEAVEQLGAQAAFLAAESAEQLDTVESELFTFSRTVSGSPDLQLALTDPAAPASAKAGLVGTLLAGRATEQTIQVLGYALGHLRGRRADSVLADLMDLAAEQRDRAVAEVRVARALEPEQATRLAAALSRLRGREVRLNIAVDPEVIGGVSVRIGSDVIDSTMATRIEQARRTLVG